MLHVAPYISLAGLEAALGAIRYTTTQKSFEGMLELYLVKEYMIRHQIAHSDRRRHFALSNVLSSTIIDNYRQSRQDVLGEPVVPTNVAEKQVATVEDVASGNSALVAWSLLHCRYCLPGLEADMGDLAELYGSSARTIRRHTKRGLELLAHDLVQRETQARQRLRRQRVSASLPSARLPFHVGRQDELSTLSRAYHTRAGLILLLTGEAGIGKSHLLDVFLSAHLRDAEAPQHLIWIHRPASVPSVVAHVKTRLFQDAIHLNVPDYTQAHRVTVVLDHADRVLADVHLLRTELGRIDILATARQCRQQEILSRIQTHIHLEALPKVDVKAYWQNLRRLDGNAVNVRDEVRQTGNPGRILAVSRGQAQQDGSLGEFRRVLERLNVDAAGRLLVASVLPHRTVRMSDEDMLRGLVDEDILHRQSDGYHLSSSIAEQLQLAWESGQALTLLAQLADWLVQQQEQHTNDVSEIALQAAEIILSRFRSLGVTYRERLLVHFWEMGVWAGRIPTWAALLEDFTAEREEFDCVLLRALGVVHMKLRRHDAASDYLWQCVDAAGARGEFEEQAYALLSLAGLSRRLGRYREALEHTERAARQMRSDEGQQLCWLEKARIMLDMGDVRQVQICLLQVELSPRAHPSVLALRSQVAALTGEFEEGLALGERLRELWSARGCITLAQVHMHAGNLNKAEDEYMQAVQHLSDVEDTYLLARLGTNLAACMMHEEEWERAYALLTHSKHQQEISRDRLGLVATQHNIDLLHRHLAIS